MKRTSGRFVATQSHHETVNAFVPEPLPPTAPDLDAKSYQQPNHRAELALARLSGMTGLVTSGEWLIYSAIRREALLTSQLEGTQATLTDIFDEEAGLSVTNANDVEEVTRYLQAFKFVREQILSPTGLPVSVRLLTQAHKVLLNGVRGANKQPGNLRTSQNWIGGTRPGNAAYVPPPPEHVTHLLADLEIFIHDEKTTLPPLVRIALAHAQFETIHPFLDGNGRIGRLLIAMLLETWKLLPQPLLYVSGYLKAHQAEYYRCLSEIRSHGDWESWVVFFLKGVEIAAEEAQQSIIQIASLIATDRKKILATASSTLQTLRLFELLPTMPKLTVERAQAELAVSFPTANAAIKALENAGILLETTGRLRGKSYVYQAYVDVLRND
ncbi:Fic family protein [Serratia quinivorans]|jgi:Fic family protein|uniref:Fic family protein n=1 Tax=Serratia quinivorans TaxID=137545 RepID=UPI0021787232|nr:Fic family protein [Serratia quinivorans]CAI1170799.1 Fic/DOC family [Serratia quinivorans]CAI2144469.1 Fic/DOC family [Serratia quinivorans]